MKRIKIKYLEHLSDNKVAFLMALLVMMINLFLNKTAAQISKQVYTVKTTAKVI